jgi:hypothetical protein
MFSAREPSHFNWPLTGKLRSFDAEYFSLKKLSQL